MFFVVLLSLYVQVFVLMPAQKKYEEKYNKKILLDDKVDYQDRVSLLVEKYNSVAPVIGTIEDKLERSFTQAELTRKFDTLASQYGLEVVTMDTKKGDVVPGYQSYVNEIVFKASYASTKKALLSLRDLPGFNSISKFSLKRDSDSKTLRGTITLLTVRSGR